LNEVIELSDSLIVVYGGEIVAYFEDTKTISEEELGYYMLGIKKQSEDEIRRAIYA
jgi:simple sugar transport system ATP-binding protein